MGSGKDSKEAIDRILHQKTHFQLYFLGMVQDINMSNSKKWDSEADLIDIVEEAQIEGKLPVASKEDDKVLVYVSRHGITVTDLAEKQVLQRHPLHQITQLIQYDDGLGKQNIAVKIGQEMAQKVCLCVKKIFDAITGKT